MLSKDRAQELLPRLLRQAEEAHWPHVAARAYAFEDILAALEAAGASDAVLDAVKLHRP